MARRDRRPRGAPEDLEPYHGCLADAEIGLEPLAVGWLERGRTYQQGKPPAGFTEVLATFCREPYIVCRLPRPQLCPLCREAVLTSGEEGHTSGGGEVRVIGEMDVFAAPDLILHYVQAHDYLPPRVFVQAVQQGPAAGSPEHRALIRALRSSS